MLNELLKRPVIPVIVIEDANDAEPLAEAMLEGSTSESKLIRNINMMHKLLCE